MLRALRWAIIWALIILWLCLIPGDDLPEWDWFALLDLDKLVHARMFGTLAVLLAGAFIAQKRPARFVLWAVVISALYGLSTEWMQGLEALGRRTDINDMIANTVGSILGAWFVAYRSRKGKVFLPAFLR